VDDSTILSVVTDPPNSTTATVPANYIEEDDDVIKRENLPRRKNLINKHGPVLPTAQSTITSAFGTLQKKAKKNLFTRQVFDAVEYATKTGVMSTLPVEHNKQPWYSGWWSGRYERTAPTIKILTSAESDVRYAAEMAGNLLRLRAHPSHRAIEAMYNTLQSELEKIGEAKDATKKYVYPACGER